MDDYQEEDTAEHERPQNGPNGLEEAIAELEALSQRRIALEAVDEMMD